MYLSPKTERYPSEPPVVRQVISKKISAEQELIQELERKVESWQRKVRQPEEPGLGVQKCLDSAFSIAWTRRSEKTGLTGYSPRTAQVELLNSKEAALETNIERLYSAAKRRVARQNEELQELSAHKRPKTEG